MPRTISPLRAYGFFWVTLALFLASLVGHWIFAWLTYSDEQAALGQAPEFAGYFVQVARDTLENWQSEFLQLIWQVAGLAFLLHLGSPQSKEGDERKEEKLDLILKSLHPDKAEGMIRELDRKYPRK